MALLPTTKIKIRNDAALHRHEIDFAQRNTTGSHFCVIKSAIAGHGNDVLRQAPNKVFALFA